MIKKHRNFIQYFFVLTIFKSSEKTNAFTIKPTPQNAVKSIYANRHPSLHLFSGISCFSDVSQSWSTKEDIRICTQLSSSNDENNEKDDAEDEATKLRKKAEQLRQEVDQLKENLDRTRSQRATSSLMDDVISATAPKRTKKHPLSDKRVLVVGANGRLGSMVCRYLLRTYPQIKELVAAVHTVSENSRTNRGYGRLSYEVGAEDGRGNIGAAWSEERDAYFEYTSEMESYHLNKLRVMEVELLDPVQCQTITEDVDCVIFCATDFNGNTPRAVSGLNVAFLFRALADPQKGRVEIEGLRNLLEGLSSSKKSKAWTERLQNNPQIQQGEETNKEKEPTSVILVSTSDQAFSDFETPFGTFKDIKRQGETLLEEEFPSLSKCILKMCKYEDNFVDENLDVQYDEATIYDEENLQELENQNMRRRINRRDAARFTVDALINDELVGKKVEVWTASR